MDLDLAASLSLIFKRRSGRSLNIGDSDDDDNEARAFSREAKESEHSLAKQRRGWLDNVDRVHKENGYYSNITLL